MWFLNLFGFEEGGYGSWRDDRLNVLMRLQYWQGMLRSCVNGRVFRAGWFQKPSLSELRENAEKHRKEFGGMVETKMNVFEVSADVADLMIDPENADAVFQVASQFNCLEMPSPDFVPEDGIDGYDCDMTQGPRSAIAAGAGLVYRNYFIPFTTQIGQTKDMQVDCFKRLGAKLVEQAGPFYKMQNGYALLQDNYSLRSVEEYIWHLYTDNLPEYQMLQGLLDVGVQDGTEVTWRYPAARGQCVTQVFCSALPLSYSGITDVGQVRALARFVLEAQYEAAICVAIKNISKSNKLFLTHIGADAFGNPREWVEQAMMQTLGKYNNFPLEVFIVNQP